MDIKSHLKILQILESEILLGICPTQNTATHRILAGPHISVY